MFGLLTVFMMVSNSYQSPNHDGFCYLMLYRTEAKAYIMDGVTADVRKGYINRWGDFISEGSLRPDGRYEFFNDVYNQPWGSDELLYEFKSGMLIPGRLGGNKQFIPSKDPIITLDEYLAFMNWHKVDLDKVYAKPEGYPDFDFDKFKSVMIDPGNGAKPIVVRRIYNLPGVLVRKSKYEEEKKRLFKLPFSVEPNKPVKK